MGDYLLLLAFCASMTALFWTFRYPFGRKFDREERAFHAEWRRAYAEQERLKREVHD